MEGLITFAKDNEDCRYQQLGIVVGGINLNFLRYKRRLTLTFYYTFAHLWLDTMQGQHNPASADHIFLCGGDFSGIFLKAAGMKITEDTEKENLCLSISRKHIIDKLTAVTTEYTGIWRNFLLKT